MPSRHFSACLFTPCVLVFLVTSWSRLASYLVCLAVLKMKFTLDRTAMFWWSVIRGSENLKYWKLVQTLRLEVYTLVIKWTERDWNVLGVFVCGNTSTGSGLTVTMTKESGGDHALEAGALILADRGCCCIDEFDKMTTQHSVRTLIYNTFLICKDEMRTSKWKCKDINFFCFETYPSHT